MTRYSKYYDTKPARPHLPIGVTYSRVIELAALCGWILTRTSVHYLRLEIPSKHSFDSCEVRQFHSIEEAYSYIKDKAMGLRPQYS